MSLQTGGLPCAVSGMPGRRRRRSLLPRCRLRTPVLQGQLRVKGCRAAPCLGSFHRPQDRWREMGPGMGRGAR